MASLMEKAERHRGAMQLGDVGTARGLAGVVGISERAAQDFLARHGGGPGSTLGEMVLAYCANLRKHAAGRGADNAESLTAARIRESTAKAMRYELDVAERLRLLIPAGEIEPALRDWATRGSQAIESAAEHITNHVESHFGITLDDAHVREHLRAVAGVIAAYPRDLAATAAAGLDGLGAAPADSDG